ncbi:MAG: serine hydrolase domain-containing protein [Bacteroidota bacterium]
MKRKILAGLLCVRRCAPAKVKQIQIIKIKVLAALLIICSSTFGQDKLVTRLDGSKISSAEIDTTVKRLMNAANVQGLNLAILNNKKTVFIKSYGFRNKPMNTLLDTSTIVYGASFSKAVFGYLVMKLVEEKILDLDKPLYQYLEKPVPEYEYFSDLKNDDRWKIITARMCLSHTTGLPNVRWFNPITSEQRYAWRYQNILHTRNKICLFGRRGLNSCNWRLKKLLKKILMNWRRKKYSDPWE